jgi:hypothetical protein
VKIPGWEKEYPGEPRLHMGNIFPARKSLVSDTPVCDSGKELGLFYSVLYILHTSITHLSDTQHVKAHRLAIRSDKPPTYTSLHHFWFFNCSNFSPEETAGVGGYTFFCQIWGAAAKTSDERSNQATVSHPPPLPFSLTLSNPL